jgi:lactoylglutathione lyase
MTSFAESPETPHKFSWQQTMLRIKDPLKSVPFYEENFGFKLIHRYDFDEWGFSLYFMAILPEGDEAPCGSPQESEDYLWRMKGVCLELTHNHGSEKNETFAVNNGNVEPFRGFGV